MLTTKQMICNLTAGQIAKCLDPQECSFGVQIINGSFYWIDSPGNISEIFSLNMDALGYRWEIINEYVSFSKAIEAFISGKKIMSFDCNDDLINIYDPIKGKNGCIEIYEILNCNWAVDEENDYR